MIGQKVLITQHRVPPFEAIVVGVLNEDVLAVRRKSSQKDINVDLYDVRSLEHGKY